MTVSQNRDAGVTYLEFSLSDSSYPFVAMSTVGEVEIMLEQIIPRDDASCAVFFSVLGTDPEEVLRLASRHHSADAHIVERYQDGGLFEFLVQDNCPTVHLGVLGAFPRRVEGLNGEGLITADVPPSEDVLRITDRFLDAHPDGELVVKRQQPYEAPVFSHRHFQEVVQGQFTERQQEALVVAHEAGFYNWPRDSTGEELADELSIAPATFHEHLRAAEKKLVALSLG